MGNVVEVQVAGTRESQTWTGLGRGWTSGHGGAHFPDLMQSVQTRLTASSSWVPDTRDKYLQVVHPPSLPHTFRDSTGTAPKPSVAKQRSPSSSETCLDPPRPTCPLVGAHPTTDPGRAARRDRSEMSGAMTPEQLSDLKCVTTPPEPHPIRPFPLTPVVHTLGDLCPCAWPPCTAWPPSARLLDPWPS